MDVVVYLIGFAAAWMIGFGVRRPLAGRLSAEKGIGLVVGGLVGFIVAALTWPSVDGGQLGAVGDLADSVLKLMVLLAGVWAGVASGRR